MLILINELSISSFEQEVGKLKAALASLAQQKQENIIFVNIEGSHVLSKFFLSYYKELINLHKAEAYEIMSDDIFEKLASEKPQLYNKSKVRDLKLREEKNIYLAGEGITLLGKVLKKLNAPPNLIEGREASLTNEEQNKISEFIKNHFCYKHLVSMKTGEQFHLLPSSSKKRHFKKVTQKRLWPDNCSVPYHMRMYLNTD